MRINTTTKPSTNQSILLIIALLSCQFKIVESSTPYLRIRTLQQSPNDTNDDSSSSMVASIPLHWNLILIVFLVSLSAMFSGLTLGLMSLDKNGLEIVMSGDDPTLSKAAHKIYPVRNDGNLLLCTLLLGNVAVNSLLSILMADITSGLVGFLVSTGVIVIFGEIVPQAACSRYALQIGSRSVPLVRVVRFFLYPIAKPLALSLDLILGQELGTIYSKSELSKLLEIEVREGRMDKDTGTTMRGALKYQDVLVEEVLKPLTEVFMLNADDYLDMEAMVSIFKAGFSRIPVYEVSRTNIIGLIFVKDLIFVDKESHISIRSLVQIFGRSVNVVWADDKLGNVLRVFTQGKSHMALVKDIVSNDKSGKDPFYQIKGIITLEDIIEVILGEEILDETDAFIDSQTKMKVNKSHLEWTRLKLLNLDITTEKLSEDEVKAITAHLRLNYADFFKLLSDKQLRNLVAATPVSEFEAPLEDETIPKQYLYENGTAADACTLILNGKITVLAGKEQMRSELSNWSVIAAGALKDSSYSPDFTAYVSSPTCRCIQISRESFVMSIDASAEERLNKEVKNKQMQEIEKLKTSNSRDASVGASKNSSGRSSRNSSPTAQSRKRNGSPTRYNEISASESDTCTEDTKIEITDSVSGE